MADSIQTPVYGFKNKTVQDNYTGNPNTPNKVGQPYILDLITLERLVFQNIPMEGLKYSPDANWMAVASAGRNNPLYQYMGGEDVLAFTISWYAEEIAKQDVLRKTKWLEALSKNNGYDEKPHMVQFVMGDMYRDAKWVVTSAGPIEFSLFDRTAGMMPRMASQELTLKRITDSNRTRTEILSIYS